MVPNLMKYVGNVSRATQSTTIAMHTDALQRRPTGRKAKAAKQERKHIVTTLHAGIGDRDVTDIADAKEFLLEELRQTMKTIRAKTTHVMLHSCVDKQHAPSTSVVAMVAASASTATAAASASTAAAATAQNGVNHLRAL